MAPAATRPARDAGVGEASTSTGDLALLIGDAARDLLATAIATTGGHLLAYTASAVDHRPGGAGRAGSTTVSFRARVMWPDGEQTETLAASTAPLPERTASGVLSLSDGKSRVAVWRFRDDPELPALSAATDPAAMAALLGSLGVSAPDGGPVDPATVRLDVRGYRPRRRAVVEIGAPGTRLFVKVLRPGAVRALHERHVLLHGAGVPVPRSLGWTDEGLLVLGARAGSTVRERMRARAPLPSAAELVRVLDALPEEVLTLPRRPSWTDNVGHYAAVVGATARHEAARAADLAAVVAAGTGGVGTGGDGSSAEATHGDYYETQLLVETDVGRAGRPRRAGGQPRVSGVLDVDTAGPGRRADDLACLLAHASLLANIEPAHQRETSAAIARWLQDFEASPLVNPRDLRLRVAGVLVSLATGPYRVQQHGWRQATTRRLDLAERWVRSAG